MNERINAIKSRHSDFESLFLDDEFSHPLQLLIRGQGGCTKLKSTEKHIEMLTVTQEKESEFFWQEAAASNLLAKLYLLSEQHELARQQLNRTLEHAPNNINAIVGMVRILKTLHRESEAQTMTDQLSGLLKESEELDKQVMICKGEIAYACSFLGPAELYMHSIDRYEALLCPDSRTGTVKDELNDYVLRWKYHLAYTYNRMLNKGHKAHLAEKLGTKDMGVIFDKIFRLYNAVIRSEDQFYKGKAMIDLVDAHKKCETSGNYQEIQFPYEYSPDEYVKQALDTAPDDPHVLERCGRHYRQRAGSKKEFDEAVAIFDRLLELHPSRHVAWHQKGLACRALWHIVGNYEERRLYGNSARKGDKKRVRKYTRGASAGAEGECYEFDKLLASLPRQRARDPAITQVLRCDNEDNEQVSGTQETPSSPQKVPQNAPRELPTLLPRNKQQVGVAPRQTKKPDFFDRLRTSNPLFKENRSLKFLQQAKECFEKAKEITKGTCSPYIVDLARCLVSLNDYKAAEAEFVAAKMLSSTMNHNDATYLYEQWALLRHRIAEQEQCPDKARLLMKDAALLYRQAILSAVRARERSRIAFYNLRDVLRDELEHDAGNTAVRMEYDVLNSSAEKYGEQKEKNLLVKALETDKETTKTAWHLIKLLHSRRHRHDAVIAFIYLTALYEARQLHLSEVFPSTDCNKQSNKQLLIDVVWQLERDGDQTNSDNGQTFGEIFRWIVGTRHISDYMEADASTRGSFAVKGGMCILAPSDHAPGLDRIVRVVRDVCGIAVVKAYYDGNCDILPGWLISEGLRSVVASSQSVVLVEDSKDAQNWRGLFPVLEELMTIREVKMCRVADASTDCSLTEPRYVKRWPRVTIKPDCDDVDLAYELLKTMFCET